MDPPPAAAPDPLLGRRIGHYRLTRRLGEGGMGVVYLAEREDEFRRRAAIKLVRFAMGSEEIVRRFQNERQTLAALSHPNIVALLDGGATEDGMPYLVMEYIEGIPIDRYCHERRLTVAERLRLFLQVCGAVQFAHQNLVIHCDLKPGNILVPPDGAPKLLDFGIAKLLGAPAPEMAAYMTVAGPRPFTPNYASPEQLLARPLATTSDVYSLGVILYQLLAGRSPYRLDTHSQAEIVGAVCFNEPARPSAAAPGAPQARHLEGDLDAIVLKALRKEPKDRYSSVEQFAADIRRHLDGLPVSARKGTFRYRAAKFIARNRVSVAATAVVAIAVVAGTSMVVWEGGVALAARARAERRFNDVRKLADFLLFDFHDAVQKLPGSTPVQQMLVERSLKYLDGLAAESAGDAGLQLDLIEAYVKFGDIQGNPYTQNLGDTAGALASYNKALALAGPLGRARPSDARVARQQGQVYQHMSDVQFLLRRMEEATANSRRAIAIFERAVAAQPADLNVRMDLAASLDGLGDQLRGGLSDTAGALGSYRKSLDQWQTARGLNRSHPRVLRASATLSMKIADIEAAADQRAAIERYRQGLAILDALPAAERASVPSRRLEATLLNHTGDSLWEVQDRQGAVESYRKSVEVLAALAALDPTNARAQFDVVAPLNSLGQSYELLNDNAAALRAYSQIVDILEGLVRNDPANAAWRAHLAEILVRAGGMLQKTGQAVEAHRQTARGLAVATELGELAGTPAPELVRAARLLVYCDPADLRRPADAARYARRAVEMTKGADAYALDTLAEAHLQSGNKDAARAAIEEGLKAAPPAAPGQPIPWLRRLLEAKLERLK